MKECTDYSVLKAWKVSTHAFLKVQYFFFLLTVVVIAILCEVHSNDVVC
jgi:hypothetical protein